MAKIFIDIDILPKAYRKLELSLKQAWFYIWTHCDKSGVWEIDKDLFEFENGFEFELQNFSEAYGELIEVAEDKILMKDFIKINYGTLTDNYNPHKPVFRDMAKNNIKLHPSLNQACFKLVDIDEDKEEDEYEKGKGGMGEKPKKQPKPKADPEPEVIMPFETETFKAQWQVWKVFRKKEHRFEYKTTISEQAALKELSEFAEGNEKTAIAIIHQSIAKGWKGFFELKNQPHGTGQQQNTGNSKTKYSADFLSKIAEGLQSG